MYSITQIIVQCTHYFIYCSREQRDEGNWVPDQHSEVAQPYWGHSNHPRSQQESCTNVGLPSGDPKKHCIQQKAKDQAGRYSEPSVRPFCFVFLQQKVLLTQSLATDDRCLVCLSMPSLCTDVLCIVINDYCVVYCYKIVVFCVLS